MKFRSLLLVACIVVVPLIAMFSHRIPPGARATITAFLRDLAGPRPGPTTVAAAGSAASTATPAASPSSQPIGVPVDRTSGVEQAAAAVPPGAVPAVAAPWVAPAVAPPIVLVAATAPEPEAFAPLRALGAVAIDCRPLAGVGGHVASCRLPVDGAGQLERVFQATGIDSTAAAEQLLRDVAAWKRAAPGAGRPPAPATMRF